MIIDERKFEDEHYVSIRNAEESLLPLVFTFDGGETLIIKQITRSIIVKSITTVQTVTGNGIEETVRHSPIAPTKNVFTIYTPFNGYFRDSFDINSSRSLLSSVRLSFKDPTMPELQGYIEGTTIHINSPLQSELEVIFVGIVVEKLKSKQEEENNEKIIRKINRRFTF